MRTLFQLLLPLLLPALSFLVLPSLMHAKSVIEPCSSSDSCTSLLSYILPWDSKISEIASRFQVNITDILAANSINPSIPSLGNQILRANSVFKIPISCPCVDGIRRSMSTTYGVQAADSVESIADGYGRLVSADQIRSANGINGDNQLLSRQSLVIPLPCTCFNNSNNGVATVYISYVVQRGESLSGIGLEFGTTVVDLEAVNGLARPVVDPGDILAVPISG
jgi:LysM repeat protein